MSFDVMSFLPLLGSGGLGGLLVWLAGTQRRAVETSEIEARVRKVLMAENEVLRNEIRALRVELNGVLARLEECEKLRRGER